MFEINEFATTLRPESFLRFERCIKSERFQINLAQNITLDDVECCIWHCHYWSSLCKKWSLL